MTTKGELISQIKNELKLVNSDSRLTNKFIWSVIQKHADWLVKRESKKLRILTQDEIFQTKKCVDVESAPAADTCCGIRTKCKVFRTALKLPDMYMDDQGVIIKAVYTIDGSEDFTEITVSEYQRKLENPHSKFDHTRYFFYNSGYLYFPKSTIRKVMVKAYFVDEVVNDCEPCPTCKECVSKLDTPARIPKYLLAELLDNVLKELAGLTLKVQEDEAINKNETRKN